MVPLVEPSCKPAGKPGLTVHETGVSPVVWPPMFCIVVPLTSDRLGVGKTSAMPAPGTVTLTCTVKEPPSFVAVMLTLVVF